MSWLTNPPNEVGIFTSNDSWSGITSNNYVGGLLSGGKWGDNNPDNGITTDLLYYYFPESYYPWFGRNIYAYEWTNPEKVAIQDAMDSFSNVANISFSETNNYDISNISWASLDTEGSNILLNTSGKDILGIAILPIEVAGEYAGIATVNYETYDPYDYSIALNPGSFYYSIFLHELGHALGLSHPHHNNEYYGTFPGVSNGAPYDSGDNNLNSSPWTVMTYNFHDSNVGLTPSGEDFSGFNTSLGAFDIAATQYLYGPNTNYNTGNDVYDLDENDLNGWKCLWDNGGRDKISATASNQSVNIDLRNASLQNAVGGGGFVSQVGSESLGFTIAFNSTGNCIIEDATGSNFSDIITGNGAANTLTGGSGNDILKGGTGNDTINGGTGNDKLIGGKGKDTAVFSSKSNVVNLSTTKRQNTKDGKDILIGI
ncbi:matrixin family metalloprotease, partial [Prochlorococcus sp. AH-716-N03]|nr:matrixin family metalloprotease [Prochlorococcus sp. AH-716-N03]